MKLLLLFWGVIIGTIVILGSYSLGYFEPELVEEELVEEGQKITVRLSEEMGFTDP